MQNTLTTWTFYFHFIQEDVEEDNGKIEEDKGEDNGKEETEGTGDNKCEDYYKSCTCM